MEVNSLFSKLRPNYQLEYCITKRKKDEYNIFYASGQNLPWLKKTENCVVFWPKQAYSQQVTDCGLINRRKAFYRHRLGPRSISFNDITIVRNFPPKKFHPWCKSKKLSKYLPPTWWEFAYDHFWTVLDRLIVAWLQSQQTSFTPSKLGTLIQLLRTLKLRIKSSR